MRGGESLGGGEDELGERSRDGEREIGARVIGVQNEPEDDNVVESGDGNLERLRRLNEAVFEKVDIAGVVERTVRMAEKIDWNKLVELRGELRDNPEIGVIYAEDYFAEVLDLSLKPRLETDEKLAERTLGDCRNGGKNADRIRVDVGQHHGDMDGVLVTLAHENWHSYQHDIIRRAKVGDEISEEMRELARLYEYNEDTYIRADLDYDGYSKQLCEMEAETFGALVKMQIDKIKAEEQKKMEFMAAHPEVYGEENRVGIEREVDGVLHGLDMGEFLRKVGVGSFDELWDANENEQIAQGYARALSDLVGLEQPMGLEFVDKLEDNKKAYWSYKTGRVMISRERMWDLQPISKLPEIAWRMRQREVARDNPESERGKLYRMNLGLRVQDGSRMHEAYMRQLLVRESGYFTEELLNVLDEQAMLEEIAAMAPEEQAKARKEQEKVGWMPVVSQKYEVKGK